MDVYFTEKDCMKGTPAAEKIVSHAYLIYPLSCENNNINSWG